jgi:hypothetical protein
VGAVPVKVTCIGAHWLLLLAETVTVWAFEINAPSKRVKNMKLRILI